MKDFLKTYAGILIGAVYALVLRLVFNIDALSGIFTLFSITFIWITPVIIGVIPFLFADKEQLDRISYRILSPVMTVLVFFMLCFLTGIEDLICLWILLIPYMLVAMFAGLLAGGIIHRIREKRGTLYSILLLPFLISPIERQFSPSSRSYSVTSRVLVHASPDVIWENIIRVRQMEAGEYSKGFYNYAGIPGPRYAELDRDTLGATRTGHFEGGLKFQETVTAWERNSRIAFDISVIPSTVRQTVFDQHVLLSRHFRFLNAEYELNPAGEGRVELLLSSTYELTTNVNTYASYCGNQLLSDFQERLLAVIRKRCEHDQRNSLRNPHPGYAGKGLESARRF